MTKKELEKEVWRLKKKIRGLEATLERGANEREARRSERIWEQRKEKV